MPELHERPVRVWLLPATGSVLLLLAFVLLSVVFTTLGLPPSEVGAQVAASGPHVLLFVPACLGLGLFAVFAEVQRAWQLPQRAAILDDLAVGTVCGLGLAAAYLMWLSSLLVELQRKLGDFVPPGSTRQALSGSLGVFFVANVVLAPLVEKTLYRGVAIPVLGERYGLPAAVLLSCMALGLLHWAGGFSYMPMAGLVAGTCFAGLYHWREGIVAPLAAHTWHSIWQSSFTPARPGATQRDT